MNVVDLIGNTPLLQLQRLAPPGVEVHAKAEWANPGGSVKDRAALAMVRAGQAELAAGQTLLDATSGNTGIAYAMLGAALGFPVELCLPKNASLERKRILQTFGARLIYTSPLEGTDGAQREAKRLVHEHPGRYFYPDQYNNEANWRAHYEGTGAEILTQTRGRVTHFVAGLGTSGTFVGVGRRLKPQGVRLISMQPDSPLHGLEGMKHMETAIVPGIYDPGLADEELSVPTEEAYEMVFRLAREEGWFVGPSGAANVVAALRVAAELREGVVVTILCDGGSRYLSDRLFARDDS